MAGMLVSKGHCVPGFCGFSAELEWLESVSGFFFLVFWKSWNIELCCSCGKVGVVQDFAVFLERLEFDCMPRRWIFLVSTGKRKKEKGKGKREKGKGKREKGKGKREKGKGKREKGKKEKRKKEPPPAQSQNAVSI
jgi:hypothetical protein